MLLHDKVLLKSGVIVETKVWRISGDKRYPDGLKYSLFAVYGGDVLVGYDNHDPKGHHRHIGEVESEYNFTTLENYETILRRILRSNLQREV